MNKLLKIFVLLLVPVFAASAHEAHVHGIAQINIGTGDDNELYIEIDGPLANYISFEHNPETKQEIEEYNNFIRSVPGKLFSNQLFKVNSEANCFVKSFDNDVDIEDGHADYELEITYKCTNIDKLESIDVRLFEQFPSLNTLKGQIVNENSQSAFELNRKKNIINLKGR